MTEWIYIVTAANTEGTEAQVMTHCNSSKQAKAIVDQMPYGGFEGPVRSSIYPIGKTFSIVE